jgi:hypothetical protein
VGVLGLGYCGRVREGSVVEVQEVVYENTLRLWGAVSQDAGKGDSKFTIAGGTTWSWLF